MDSIAKMQAQYGRFFRLRGPGVQMYFCADADIISEVRNDPKAFPKLVEGRSGQADLARKSVGNALFTASDNDPLWDQAHRILMPAFGASALKNYFGGIRAVADDLFAHLDALAPGQSFMATDIMTRMTFEAISYAAFNKRYNAIDAPDLPPFVQAMNVVLQNAMQAPRRFGPSFLYRKSNAVRAAADKVMAEEVDAIVRDRQLAMQSGAAVPTDLLQIMLTAPDRVTGQKLPAENIRGQLITFLIAGHETTSGLLSYALYHLWKNPGVRSKLMAEADAVLGRDYSYQIKYEDCARLEYTQRVLKEALRLTPTMPMFSRTIRRDARLGQGKYQVHGGERIFFSLGPLQRDPLYWGEDAGTFDPDHFTAEAEQARHPDAYHPFGMGARACIGFQFALLEAKMVLARFAQRYVARPIDRNYVLHEVQALTVKPDHLEMVLDHRPTYHGNFAVPALMLAAFPSWFAGVALATIAIGALVPASIMSIATANIFTRDIYRAFLRPAATDAQEADMAKLISLLVKLGALVFIIVLPASTAIQFQLLGGIWIIQTLPAVLLGLTRMRLHAGALLAGWACGMVVGTGMAASTHFTSAIFPLHLPGAFTAPGYAALYALILNLIVSLVLSAALNIIRGPSAARLDPAARFEF
jgi:cytochrome P450